MERRPEVFALRRRAGRVRWKAAAMRDQRIGVRVERHPRRYGPDKK